MSGWARLVTHPAILIVVCLSTITAYEVGWELCLLRLAGTHVGYRPATVAPQVEKKQALVNHNEVFGFRPAGQGHRLAAEPPTHVSAPAHARRSDHFASPLVIRAHFLLLSFDALVHPPTPLQERRQDTILDFIRLSSPASSSSRTATLAPSTTDWPGRRRLRTWCERSGPSPATRAACWQGHARRNAA